MLHPLYFLLSLSSITFQQTWKIFELAEIFDKYVTNHAFYKTKLKCPNPAFPQKIFQLQARLAER